MATAAEIVERAKAHLEDARDPNLDVSARVEAFDELRAALLDARRARATPEDLLPTFDALCTAAISDPSHHIRSVVPQAVEDLCLRDLRSFTPTGTDYLSRSLNDEHVLVAKRAVRTLTILFRRLIGFVASVGVGEDTFPESRLKKWFHMEERAISYIEALDDGLRKVAVKFTETVVLALSFSGSAGSADHFTLDYLLKKRSESHILDVSTLEGEGVRCVKQVVKLLHAGLEGLIKSVKSDSSTFRGLPPPSFMTAIAVLSNLVRRRRKILQFTLPPLLDVVYAITGSRGAPSRAFQDLSESQKQSIINVLRFSLRAMFAYPHARSGRAGADISAATTDLSNYEKEQEFLRKRMAKAAAAKAAAAKAAEQAAQPAAQHASGLVGIPSHAPDVHIRPIPERGPPEHQVVHKAESMSGVKNETMMQKVNSHSTPHLPMKRPRSTPQAQIQQHWPRLSPQEAMAATRALVQSMPHKEVVNFIMTRILLNIPPAETVPGASMFANRNSQSATIPTGEPSSKQMRKSRFGSTNNERKGASIPKKAVPKYKVAPPVIVPRFSDEAIEQMVAMCCRRIMSREEEALSSGAGPLRLQLLSRLLAELALRDTEAAKKFCEEACEYIVKNIDRNTSLAIAWLHRLIVLEEVSRLDLSASVQECIENDFRLSEFQTAIQQWTARNVLIDKEKGNINGIKDARSSAKEDMSMDTAENAEKTDEGSEVHEAREGLKENIEARSGAELPTIQEESRKEKKEHSDEKSSEDGPNSKNNVGADEDPAKKIVLMNGQSDARSHDAKINVEGKSNLKVAEITGQSEDYEERNKEEEEEVRLRKGVERYARVLNMLLRALVEQKDESSTGFYVMVTEAPLLPLSTIDLLRELCMDFSRRKLGLYAMRRIISERPGEDRWVCLNHLLSFAFHADEVLRGPAIRLLANQIFAETGTEVAEAIEQRATQALENAVTQEGAEESDLDRDSKLITALCGKKHELLSVLASSYAVASLAKRKVLLSRARELVEHVGVTSKYVLELIGGKLAPSEQFSLSAERFFSGTTQLAVEVLRVLVKKLRKPSEEVVKAALERYERNNNAELIIPVLPGLSKEAILLHLAELVEQVTRPAELDGENGEQKIPNGEKSSTRTSTGFKNVVSLITSNRPPSISPEDLLVELHKIEPTAGVAAAILACFESKAVFQREVVAQAVQQILEMTTVPDLFMRTVHLARIFHPDLEKYITETVMKRLIEKNVWSNSLVWEGFLKYCADIKIKSVKLLLSLPVSQLQDALEKQKSLTSIFEELLSDPKKAKRLGNTRKREVIRGAIIKLRKSRKK
ncbi:Symplekin [Gracilariopsis chorda]|uniref:Symplekin n=1 Tax=Gracilariopsis chorda TaxID=448386 RepID=A0A2V3J0P8_9FLOR|nr:Symplekin [Gracilariopsis chorda]|eukprot:PXF46940.1 Symplekin [Gracilariopsis chorda]